MRCSISSETGQNGLTFAWPQSMRPLSGDARSALRQSLSLVEAVLLRAWDRLQTETETSRMSRKR